MQHSGRSGGQMERSPRPSTVRVCSPLRPPCRACLKRLHQKTQTGQAAEVMAIHQLSSFVDKGSQKNKLCSRKSVLRKGGAGRGRVTASAAGGTVQYPEDYDEVLEQVRISTAAALKDGKQLIEIEFPTAGLDSTAGDAEGGMEMSMSMTAIREFCKMFVQTDQAPKTRIFFPDKKESVLARGGTFEGTPFKIDFLTSPSGLSDIGWEKKVKMTDRVQPSDEIFVVAYPYFNVNEMLAVEELWKDSAGPSGRPIIVFNGEMDRIRSGYYPPFFYPKLGQLAKTFLPKFEAAYYIHNFKGRYGGKLFRAYPGPWQVLRQNAQGQLEVIQESETMPTLKEVALNILPTINIGI
ncbi:hypothetical protein KFL_000250170 [Klebsormidium nitens]|uniref:DUF1995 domain-containing protein n=1 Tax=Klebsormidium nitens TaxID=105231 RepID=A0A1Y1HKM1_KLENI|nr:hypothetical protein KFL_000250170 [Klebsormidium nitens]|eukprot:GAQ79140.1 hypothetical protein KFL_000250170 [Klebsormidium nitens]